MAASMPVVIASDQSTIAVLQASQPLPTGAATSANQTNGTQQTHGVVSKNRGRHRSDLPLAEVALPVKGIDQFIAAELPRHGVNRKVTRGQVAPHIAPQRGEIDVRVSQDDARDIVFGIHEIERTAILVGKVARQLARVAVDGEVDIPFDRAPEQLVAHQPTDQIRVRVLVTEKPNDLIQDVHFLAFVSCETKNTCHPSPS